MKWIGLCDFKCQNLFCAGFAFSSNTCLLSAYCVLSWVLGCDNEPDRHGLCLQGCFYKDKKLRISVISYKETYTVRPGYKPCVTLLFIALCLFWIFLGIFGALKKIFIQWAHEHGAGESAEVPVQIVLAKWLLWLGQNNESDRHLDYPLYAKCNTSGVTFVIPCDRNQSQFFLTLNSQVNRKYLSIKAFCHLPHYLLFSFSKTQHARPPNRRGNRWGNFLVKKGSVGGRNRRGRATPVSSPLNFIRKGHFTAVYIMLK